METNTENWKDHLQKGGSLMVVILGNILYALAVKLFLMPAGLLTGGTTGIGLALNRSFGIPVATFVLIFNVTMLLIGWKVMGRKFALTTVVSTFVYPIALGFFEKVFGDLVLTQDLFLCTIFSGLGIGGSLGIVIRAGASTGGMDIPPLVLNHYFKIPVSVSVKSLLCRIMAVCSVLSLLLKCACLKCITLWQNAIIEKAIRQRLLSSWIMYG